jgi:hypothetical protein
VPGYYGVEVWLVCSTLNTRDFLVLTATYRSSRSITAI